MAAELEFELRVAKLIHKHYEIHKWTQEQECKYKEANKGKPGYDPHYSPPQAEVDKYAAGLDVERAWNDLAGDLRESNLDAARDIPYKLSKIHCHLVRKGDRTSKTLFKMTDEDVETLAVLEHERWNRERILQGWSLGGQKDIANRLSPYLRPFNELPVNMQDYDRDAVRSLPRILDELGLQIRENPERGSKRCSHRGEAAT